MQPNLSPVLKPHPLAERYPLLEGEDFAAFKESIRTNGQRLPVMRYEGMILDGRNRDRACRELGIEPKYEDFHGTAEEAAVLSDVLNLHRRHLTRQQMRAVIAFKLTLNPERSDRDIAAEVKASHCTVAKVRSAISSTGQSVQLEAPTRKGRDGKRRPATQPKKPTPPPASAPTPIPKPSAETRDSRETILRPPLFAMF